MRTMNLSFAGCGFLGIYHVGVASCIRGYAPGLYVDKISGASAGAIAAAGLITHCDMGLATTYVLEVAQQARARTLGPLHPSFDLVAGLRKGLNRFLPKNAHEICSGRLHVSLTRVVDKANVVITEFDSKEDLIQALICSAFVPFYCGIMPPKYKGVRYVDGCLSNNILILDENTITVSPFAGESDICPSDNSANDLHMFLANTSIQFTMQNFYRLAHALFPVPPDELTQMCRQGFDDALKFLSKNGLISCTKHISIQSSILTSAGLEQGRPRVSSSSSLDLCDERNAEHVDHDAEGHRPDQCAECKSRQHAALLDSLPPAVIGALQAASDSMNKGFLAPVYNMAAFKVLSIMAAPYYLPFELAIVLGKRIWEWAPYLPSDLQWFVGELSVLLTQLLASIHSRRHRYTARFTCQLAITDVDYNRETTFTAAATPSDTPLLHRRDTISARQRNLNVGISVGFQSHYKNPIECVDDLRLRLIESAEAVHSRAGDEAAAAMPSSSDSEFYALTDMDSNTSLASSDSRPQPSRSRQDSVSSQLNETNYDTFEHCLQKASEMETMLAFYYQDEKNPNVVRVTEILSIDDGLHVSRSSSPSSSRRVLATASLQDVRPGWHDPPPAVDFAQTLDGDGGTDLVRSGSVDRDILRGRARARRVHLQSSESSL